LTMNSSNTNCEKHEMLCMRSKLGCFTRYTRRNFKQLYSTIVPRLAKTRITPHKETIKR
jgi:hypothetical protein